jgi:hypothetical protein
MKEFLSSTYFIDFENQIISDFVDRKIKESMTTTEKAIAIFYAVRDELFYDPYRIVLKAEFMRASAVVSRKFGYCVEKSLVLTTCLRYAGIPARLGFADVKNHLNTKRLHELMQTDVFAYHGYTEVFLEGKWVKATPAFNLSLCQKAKILPLEFDGKTDSIFHPLDANGKKHMEYITDHGAYEDLPLEEILQAYERYYPHLNVRESGTFGKLKNVQFQNEKFLKI